MDVVAGAGKNGVRAGADDQVKVAGRAAVESGVALAGEANALAVAGAGLDAEFEGLGAVDDAFAMAVGAGVLHFAAAATARALDVELHAPPIWVTWPLP